MGIADLFRPNWKHSNARIRAAAVKALEPDQVSTLLEVAEKDADAEIRALAVGRIEDAEVLEALADRASDSAVADRARSRADALWMASATQEDDATMAEEALGRVTGSDALVEVVRRSRLPDIQRLALARLEDPKALCEVVKQVANREICAAALERLSDPALLRGLVLEEPRREIAQAALDRIDDPESLKLISQRAKVKAIRTRARKQLEATQETSPTETAADLEQKKLHAQLVQLCRKVEKLANATDWDATAKALAEAEARWAQLAAGWTEPDERLVERYDNARKGFSLRYEHARAAIAKREAVREEQAAVREEHQADRAAREALLGRILELPEDATDETLAALEAEWEALGEPPEAYRAEMEGRLDTARRQWRRRQDSVVTAQEREEAFGEVLAAAEVSLEQERLGDITRSFSEHHRVWARLEKRLGRDDGLRARFSALEDRLEALIADEQAAREEQKARNLSSLERLAAKAEAAQTSDNLVQVDRFLKDVKGVLKKPGALPSREAWAELRPRLEEAAEGLVVHLRELRDQEGWKRFAAGSQQEKLVEEVESLKAVEELAEVATRLRRAQAEWKKAGPASREKSEELWTRFKTACDEAHARCEVYFQEQDAERQTNLEQKLALCDEVESLQDAEDFGETAERIKGLQQRWKEIGPVPRKQSDAIWKRFRGACDHFFERRKEWQKEQDALRGENLTVKEGLCERAEALAEATDWDATANALKALQSEWKAIGPVPRKKADAIWARFRGACDRFFERRNEYLDEGRAINLDKRRELLDELARLLDTPPEGGSTAVGARFVEAWDNWKGLSPVPQDEEAPTVERFGTLVRRALEAHKVGFLGTLLDPMLTAQKMEGLCAKAEALAVEAAELKSKMSAAAIDPNDAEAMANALKEALAASAFRKDFQQEDASRIADQLETLRRSWDRLGPLPEGEAAPLVERFEAACKSVPTPKRPGR